jgi:hypothetical protein
MLRYPNSLYVKKKNNTKIIELKKVVIKGIIGKFIDKNAGDKGNVEAKIETPTK